MAGEKLIGIIAMTTGIEYPTNTDLFTTLMVLSDIRQILENSEKPPVTGSTLS
jgi:hypothetical protein